jgi:predicted acetyltransferase
VRVRGYRPEDQPEAYRLRRLAFGGPRIAPAWEHDPGGWFGFVAEADAELVGFLRVWEYGQFFGGSAVPMGGVASVAVAPHARGRGVAGALLDAALPAMHEAGQCISALYGAVPGLYRSRGWEQAGLRQRWRLPTAALSRSAGREQLAPMRRAVEADAEAIARGYTDVAARIPGMLDRRVPAMEFPALAEPDIADVVPGADGGLRGCLLANRPDRGPLDVTDLFAADAAAGATLLASLGSWSSQIPEVELRAFDPMVLGLLAELPTADVHTEPWMLRVVDLPAAVRDRDWPAAGWWRPFAVDLDVVDEHAPWHAGRCRLVCDETVSLEPGGSGAVRLHARALGPWFAGAADAATLRRGGLLAGDAEPAAALDRLTGAPTTPRMAEFF